MRRPRYFLNTILGVVIAAAGCTGGQTLPSEPAQASLVGTLNAVLLTCSPQKAESRTKVIGPEGGELWVGPHYLVVPKNALSKKVSITGQVITGNFNSVQFYPEGLKFGSGTKLYMSYANCFGIGMLLPKKIVYLNDALSLLEILNTLDLVGSKMAVGDLRHFSRYAVAY